MATGVENPAAYGGVGISNPFSIALVNGAQPYFFASVTGVGLEIGPGASPGSFGGLFTMNNDRNVVIGDNSIGGAFTRACFNVFETQAASSSDWVAWYKRDGGDGITNGVENLIRQQHFSISPTGPSCVYAMLGANGTFAAPTAMLSGQLLGTIDGRGYDGSAVSYNEYAPGFSDGQVGLEFKTTENWSSGHHGVQLNFYTTPNASGAARVKAGAFEHDGGLIVGSVASQGAGSIANSAGIFTNQGNIADPGALGSPTYRSLATVNIIQWDAIGAAGSPVVVSRLARGTPASKSAVQSGDQLFSFQGRGFGATAYSNVQVQFVMAAAQAWTDTAQGTRLDIQTTLNGGITMVPAMRIDHDNSILVRSLAQTLMNSAGLILRRVFTVGTLPSASPAGQMAQVSDALAPTYGATVAAGGAINVPVTSDGTNWKVG